MPPFLQIYGLLLVNLQLILLIDCPHNYFTIQRHMKKKIGVAPRYDLLRTFCCVCYPWLRSYTTHKLEPRSIQCVYLGFSQVHYAHQCFDPIHSKLYVSRDVKFFENIFPFQTIFSHFKNWSFTLT